MQTVKIENWIITRNYGGTRLMGEVFGHPRFKDGDSVITSPVRRWFKNGKVRTNNTRYVLGQAHMDGAR